MAIQYTSTKITLTDGTYSLEDIYSNKPSGYTKIYKLGSSYKIDVDLYVGTSGHPAVLEDSNISLEILGELFQVYLDSEIRFGKKDGDKTFGGCFISCPNIKLVYGFGNTDKTKAGDLYLYDSVIKIWGFWGFFSGPEQRVEIIDCLVDGFGRIEGNQSILKNITFEKSHGRYGILSPKGQLDTMENLKVLDSQQDESNRVSVYFNPTYAPQMRIVGGVFGGYDKLVYTELKGSSTNPYLEFIDSEILDGYSRHTSDDETTIYHKFTFNPIFRDLNGNTIQGVQVRCSDVTGQQIFDSTSNIDGEISEEVVYYYHTGDGNDAGEIRTPHTLEITYDDVTTTRTLIINKPLKSFPFYICNASSGDGVDYTVIQDMLNTLQDNICNCVSTSEDNISQDLSSMDVGIRNILSTLGDEINQNEVKIENSSKTMQLIL